MYRELWSTFNKVLDQQQAPAGPSVITAEEFQLFFDQKVQTIRSSTAAAPAPSFSECPVDDRLVTFGPITVTDVIEAIRRLPDKQCASDMLPTRHLKQCADLLAPFLAHLFTPISLEFRLDRSSYEPVNTRRSGISCGW